MYVEDINSSILELWHYGRVGKPVEGSSCLSDKWAWFHYILVNMVQLQDNYEVMLERVTILISFWCVIRRESVNVLL